MSLKDKLVDMICQRGVFKETAEKIVEDFLKDYGDDYLLENRNSPASSYPQELFNVLWLSLRKFTYNWICKNQPEAWYKDMFKTLKELNIETKSKAVNAINDNLTKQQKEYKHADEVARFPVDMLQSLIQGGRRNNRISEGEYCTCTKLDEMNRGSEGNV